MLISEFESKIAKKKKIRLTWDDDSINSLFEHYDLKKSVYIFVLL